METMNSTTTTTTSTTPTITGHNINDNPVQTFTTPTLPGVTLRVLVGSDGEPWFVARDVAKILELGTPRTSLALLDEDEKGVHTVDTPGGKQEMSIISEAGLYSLVLRSRKPEAKPFKRWVTHEVLPAIRKHGGYLSPAKLEEALTDPDTIIRLATALKKERDMRKIAETARDAAETMLEDAAPKARTYDAVMAPRKLELLTFCRRFRDVNLNRVKDSLERAGVMYRRAGIYKIYATYRDSHFSERTDVKTGRLIIIVEPKGQQLLARLWNEGKLARKKNKTTLD